MRARFPRTFDSKLPFFLFFLQAHSSRDIYSNIFLPCPCETNSDNFGFAKVYTQRDATSSPPTVQFGTGNSIFKHKPFSVSLDSPIPGEITKPQYEALRKGFGTADILHKSMSPGCQCQILIHAHTHTIKSLTTVNPCLCSPLYLLKPWPEVEERKMKTK